MDAMSPPPATASDDVTQGLALVDYDNLRSFRRKSKADFEQHAADLMDMLPQVFRTVFPLQELDIRFYGGWTDEYGLPSRDAHWLLQTLPGLRGRRNSTEDGRMNTDSRAAMRIGSCRRCPAFEAGGMD